MFCQTTELDVDGFLGAKDLKLYEMSQRAVNSRVHYLLLIYFTQRRIIHIRPTVLCRVL